MEFTSQQIRAAKENAKLHNIDQEMSDKQAISFLEWYHSHKTEHKSISEAKRAGLLQLDTTGVSQQFSTWQDISCSDSE
ncbi:hypothetical protein [Nostoc sp.]|uniref:hypothetical protein n=1 Tax=Nostoc sp. TaxID=1180 RepID=UPI002FFBC82E